MDHTTVGLTKSGGLRGRFERDEGPCHLIRYDPRRDHHPVQRRADVFAFQVNGIRDAFDRLAEAHRAMASPIPEFFGAPVDPALLDSAARQFIVMATRQDQGSLWKVQWEFDLPVRLDLDLAGPLEAAVQRFLSLEAVWEPNIRQLVWDYEVADHLGPFP